MWHCWLLFPVSQNSRPSALVSSRQVSCWENCCKLVRESFFPAHKYDAPPTLREIIRASPWLPPSVFVFHPLEKCLVGYGFGFVYGGKCGGGQWLSLKKFIHSLKDLVLCQFKTPVHRLCGDGQYFTSRLCWFRWLPFPYRFSWSSIIRTIRSHLLSTRWDAADNAINCFTDQCHLL